MVKNRFSLVFLYKKYTLPSCNGCKFDVFRKTTAIRFEAYGYFLKIPRIYSYKKENIPHTKRRKTNEEISHSEKIEYFANVQNKPKNLLVKREDTPQIEKFTIPIHDEN